MPLDYSGGMPLVYVQNDATYEMHKRCGRFSIQRQAAKSFPHLMKTIGEQQEKMIGDLARRGFEYTGDDWELRGPLDHLDFSDDATLDPGPSARPDPRDLEALQAFERAERARVAKKLEAAADLVDYEIVGKFKVRIPGKLRRAA